MDQSCPIATRPFHCRDNYETCLSHPPGVGGHKNMGCVVDASLTRETGRGGRRGEKVLLQQLQQQG